jgi:hypothetical protein
VNHAMRISEVYGPLNKNETIILRYKTYNEEIEYKNRYRHIQGLSHKEKQD